MRPPKAAIKLSGLIGVQSKLPLIIHQILFSNTRVWGRILRPESVKECPIWVLRVCSSHFEPPYDSFPCCWCRSTPWSEMWKSARTFVHPLGVAQGWQVQGRTLLSRTHSSPSRLLAHGWDPFGSSPSLLPSTPIPRGATRKLSFSSMCMQKFDWAVTIESPWKERQNKPPPCWLGDILLLAINSHCQRQCWQKQIIIHEKTNFVFRVAVPAIWIFTS